jgi:hypothetical protein
MASAAVDRALNVLEEQSFLYDEERPKLILEEELERKLQEEPLATVLTYEYCQCGNECQPPYVAPFRPMFNPTTTLLPETVEFKRFSGIKRPRGEKSKVEFSGLNEIYYCNTMNTCIRSTSYEKQAKNAEVLETDRSLIKVCSKCLKEDGNLTYCDKCGSYLCSVHLKYHNHNYEEEPHCYAKRHKGPTDLCQVKYFCHEHQEYSICRKCYVDSGFCLVNHCVCECDCD